MTKGLRISPDLTLPLDFVTKSTAILAQRRKGKSYTAAILAEELFAAGLPFVYLDPTGATWGLRASADGKSAGLPVIILGGEHGDLPLERTAGKFVAELVVDEPGFYVIDFKGFTSREAERQFATDFAERLYRRKGQPGSDFPMHLFVDEADVFCPQKIPSGDERMLGAFEAIVRRGGLRGLGTTLISQRAAVVNKNVLEQIDILIALRTVGPNDRKAVDGYVRSNGTEEQRAELMGSLSSLKLGEAWIWEPGADPPLYERVRIRERHTFNSSATPKPGERRVEPRRLADVDLKALEKRMADTIEKAKAEDPKELTKKLAELRREIERLGQELTKEKQKPTVTPEPVIEHVEVVPAGLEDELVESFTRRWSATKDSIVEDIRSFLKKFEAAAARPVPRPEPILRSARASSGPPGGASTNGHGGSLGKGERRVLVAVAQHGGGVTREQLTILTGYKRATRNTYVQRLGAAGQIAIRDSRIHATDVGVATLGDDYEPLPTGSALREHWLGRLPEGEGKILRELAAVWPDGIPREELSERTGYSRATRNTYIQRLGARELVEVQGQTIFAADELFDLAEAR